MKDTVKNKKSGIDWSRYKNRSMDEGERFSQKTIEEKSSLILNNPEMNEEARYLLEECYQYYENLDEFRRNRARYRNLYVGDHYEEMIYDPDTCETMTRGDYIRSKGMDPIKNNQIRQAIKNLIGQFRDNDNMSTVISRERENQLAGEMMTKTLQASLQLNNTKELDVRQFEEFLVSGFFGWKNYYAYHKNRRIMDVDVATAHPARIFFNTGITDIRLREIHTVGEILDCTMNELLQSFATNKYDKQQILDWYGIGDEKLHSFYAHSDTMVQQNSDVVDDIDFYNVNDGGRYRVYEIWKEVNEEVLLVHDPNDSRWYESDQTIEELEEENWVRMNEGIDAGVSPEEIPLLEWEYKNVGIWYYWFLTPQANILQHGRNPYNHDEHPYTLGIYPLIDGNIFGLVKDVEDQQNEINRMLTKMNFIISASAQGLLMIPEDSVPKGWTPEDYADQWSKSNGVIVYKPTKTGAKPEQVVANSLNTGAMDILQIQFNLLKEISGVNESIQGQKPNAGTPSSLYAQMTHNSTLANKDFFEFFFSRRKERDYKIVKLIQQFYDEDRNIAIAGKDFDNEITHYIQELGKNLEFDMTMGSSSSSDAYRQLADENLVKFLEGNLIDFDTYLEHTSMPFADKLRASVNKKLQQSQQQMEALQQAGQNGDPQAQALMQQFMGGGQMQQGQRAA
jgi:ribulose bisphosphate carboxylase small subunit